MPQPKNLGKVITRFSEYAHYTVLDNINGKQFLITADIQQMQPQNWNRENGNINVNCDIRILVVFDGRQPILEGGNRYTIYFDGLPYTVDTVQNARRVGFMEYIGKAKVEG